MCRSIELRSKDIWFLFDFLQEYNAKLSDFGLVNDGPIGDESYTPARFMTTHVFAAPEYIATGNLFSWICQPVIRHIGLLLFWHFIITMLRKWVNETLVFHHNSFLFIYFFISSILILFFIISPFLCSWEKKYFARQGYWFCACYFC